MLANINTNPNRNMILKFSCAAVLSFLFSCASGNDITTSKKDNANSTDISCWITNPGSAVYLKKQNTVSNFSAVSNSYPSIVVDSITKYQTMDGFGFSLTGGSAYLINNLTAIKKDELLHELFSNDSASVGISYLRISMGASDLDSYVFSYDDTNTTEDVSLPGFSLGPDASNLIPILKSILAINPTLKIIATPWSAPVWMKTNKSAKGGSLKPEYFAAYSLYFVKYIHAMKEQGITIDAITPQNEPLNPDNNPSMYMSALDQAAFIKNNLGPAFAKSNISTKIVLYDHNCDRPDYPLTILNDPEARNYSDGSAFHLYGGNITALTTVHNAFPDKNIYFTEQWVGGPGNFAEDLKWHVKNLIIGATRNWSKNVIEWNLAADANYDPHTIGGCSTCMGALTIGSTVTRNVSYYIIAHASKFVPLGSVRIESNMILNLPNVAFLTPEGKKVLIVLNESASNQTFNIRFKNKYSVQNLAAGSVATYIW